MLSRGTWSSRLSLRMPVRLLDDVFCRFDNGAHSDAIVVDELVWFPAVRNGANGELMDSDALGLDGVEHGIAQSTMRIMIFNGQQSSVRCRRASQQRRAIDRHDAVEIDDPRRDAGRLELV